MESFRLIPVMDIKEGLAVHAVKGLRNAYKPVACDWCSDGNINELIAGYRDEFNLQDLYIADLDSILLDTMDASMYKMIRDAVKGHIMIDAGITTFEKFQELDGYRFDEIILGTESIRDLHIFDRIIEENKVKTIISLDFRDGALVTPIKSLRDAPVHDAIATLEDMKPDAFIFLELSRVGSKTGINHLAVDVLEKIQTPLLLGGGIKDMGQVLASRARGFAGVLIATALQANLITPEEIKEMKKKEIGR
ncbi:MAG: HisA/HisF-related TIM barrel protein [Promethearchaeota archaeon]